MKKSGLLLLISLFATCLLTGCSLQQNGALPVSGTDTVQINLYAKEYLGVSKSQIEPLLGGLVEEEYYNGGLIFRFSRSDIWFGFGCGTDSFPDIPEDAQCEFILAPLKSAADFEKAFLSEADLTEKLGFSFGDPSFNEHDGIYDYYAEENGIICSVSCSEDGTVSLDEDYVTYWIDKERE